MNLGNFNDSLKMFNMQRSIEKQQYNRISIHCIRCHYSVHAGLTGKYRSTGRPAGLKSGPVPDRPVADTGSISDVLPVLLVLPKSNEYREYMRST